MQIMQSGAQALDWLSAIKSNFAYIGTVAAAGIAGEVANLQLLNPAGSQREVYVHSINGAASLAGSLYITRHSVALTTLDSVVKSLSQPGTDGLSQLRWVSNASALGTIVWITRIEANKSQDLFWEWSFILQPGEGIVLSNNVVTASLTLAVTVAEIPIA